MPEGAIEEPTASLPRLDLPPIAGAEVASRRGWTAEGGLTLRGACVRAPSDRWAPGVEEIVLGRATAMARGAVPAELDRWSAGEIRTAGDRFEQKLDGTGAAAGTRIEAAGRHILGFVGPEPRVFLCTVVCAEPEGGHRCAGLVDGAEPFGSFAPAPPPSLSTRAILLAAEHPAAAVAISGALTLAAITLILARRPRPRR